MTGSVVPHNNLCSLSFYKDVIIQMIKRYQHYANKYTKKVVFVTRRACATITEIVIFNHLISNNHFNKRNLIQENMYLQLIWPGFDLGYFVKFMEKHLSLHVARLYDFY